MNTPEITSSAVRARARASPAACAARAPCPPSCMAAPRADHHRQPARCAAHHPRPRGHHAAALAEGRGRWRRADGHHPRHAVRSRDRKARARGTSRRSAPTAPSPCGWPCIRGRGRRRAGHEGHPQPRHARGRVSTLPTNIPERIDADVSNLAIGDVLTVRDLRPPEGVRIVKTRARRSRPVSPPMPRKSRPRRRLPRPSRRRSRRSSPSASPRKRARRRGRRQEGPRGRRREEARAEEGREESKPEATRWPMWWWGSGTRDRSTGTPATTSASASSSISRGSSRRPASRRPRAGGARLVAWRHLYLVKPQSFMNVSGPSVRHVLHALGRARGPGARLRRHRHGARQGPHALRGSAGGHNGVQSVIDALGTEAIRRVKIGIGRPPQKSQCRPRAHDLRAGGGRDRRHRGGDRRRARAGLLRLERRRERDDGAAPARAGQSAV